MTIHKILIADDDAEDGEFFTMAVQKIDPAIEVEVAANTDELFAFLNQSLPDLLFIDSFLRQESGHASIEAIRANERYKTLPIIMYTGAADPDSVQRAFSAGASFYVVKPHSLQEIETVLRGLLTRDWSQEVTSQQLYINHRFKDYWATA